MENTSHNCESYYQIALERRAAGLSVSDVPDLETHLVNCAACRDYLESMTKIAAMVQTGNAAVEVVGSWRRARAFIERKERERAKVFKEQVPLGLGIGLLIVSYGILMNAHSYLFIGLGSITYSALSLGYHRYKALKLSALAGSSDDILHLAKKELKRRTFGAWSGLLFAAVSAAFYFFCAISSPPEWFPQIGLGEKPWVFGVLGLCFLVVVHMVWTETLPRLRRERKKLE